MGPFSAWPTGSGFEHFYGFIGGETNQSHPAIYQDTVPIEPDRTPEEGYHFTEDMTDQAIDWIRQQKSLMPDKPFFVYYAPGATHAPHHVRPEWSDKYKGKFDEGWDALREQAFARQKELGVIPPEAELTERPEEIPAWDDMPEDLKPVLARQMEVYAGFLEHTDHHVGRLIDALSDLEILENTLVYYVIGDNGASAEGDPERVLQRARDPERRVRDRDDRVHGLADRRLRHAQCVQPLRSRVGSRDGHALPVDEAGGLPLGRYPEWHDRALARRLQRTWRGPLAVPPRDRRRCDGTRGCGPSGTTERQRRAAAAARRRVDGLLVRRRRRRRSAHDPVLRDVLQSRHLPRGLDRCDAAQHSVDRVRVARLRRRRLGALRTGRLVQAYDLADDQPDKLRDLQRLFLIEATKYNVLPLDDRRFERFNPDIAGRPQLVTGTSQLLFGGMGRLSENSVIANKNKSHAITAQVDVPAGGAEGVIIAQGGAFGGFALYAKDGKPAYCYNLFGLKQFKVYGNDPIPEGEHQVRMEFTYDGGGLGKGGDVALYVDGEQVGSGRVDGTVPMIFSADETTTSVRTAQRR